MLTQMYEVTWYHYAATSYLIQCWPRCMKPYDIIMPQRVTWSNVDPDVWSHMISLCRNELLDPMLTQMYEVIWYHYAATSYLIQCWPRCMKPCDIIMPQRVTWSNVDPDVLSHMISLCRNELPDPMLTQMYEVIWYHYAATSHLIQCWPRLTRPYMYITNSTSV